MPKTITTDRGFELIKDHPHEYHVTDCRGRHALITAHIQWSERYRAYLGWHGGMGWDAIRCEDLYECWLMLIERCLIDFPEAA